MSRFFEPHVSRCTLTAESGATRCTDYLLLGAIGFLAQLVDGALGMAFGVISTTAMLSMGMPPAQASAIVHTAEIFTTGASAGSHSGIAMSTGGW